MGESPWSPLSVMLPLSGLCSVLPASEGSPLPTRLAGICMACDLSRERRLRLTSMCVARSALSSGAELQAGTHPVGLRSPRSGCRVKCHMVSDAADKRNMNVRAARFAAQWPLQVGCQAKGEELEADGVAM